MPKIFIKPVDGKRLKDPVTMELIPARGKRVTKSSYWLRRLKAGDCVEAESLKPVVPQAPEKKKRSKREDKPHREGDK